ncbi:hypothetical protein J1614_005793 [Plenodomus biglobosus]|nr:hypothetical protein J1614_005793 [Plenodomus biglobosus]
MKFLCLHGSFGSAKKFQIQLASFVQKTEQDFGFKFKFNSGLHPVNPPPGFEDYFGEPPLFRYMPFDGILAYEDIFHKLHECPEEQTADETMRLFFGSDDNYAFQKTSLKRTIDEILRIVAEDPEITGILGYSEGATIAATAVLEERRRWEEEGIPRRIECGIFFSGCPPLSLKNDSMSVLLGDECEDIIDIPTCHIVGCNDPYLEGAMSLYNMCQDDIAELFDHGQGHVIPRDARTMAELSVAVSKVLDMTDSSCRKALVTGSESDISGRSSPWDSGRSTSSEAQ